MLFDAKLFSQKQKLMLKLLYQPKIALIQNFSEIDRRKSKIMKNQKIRTMLHKIGQVFDFSVFKNLKLIVVKLLQK